MDTMEEMLSMLLDGAVETLDISPHLRQLAVDKYEEVGAWLAEHGTPDWRIYPQGSFRLGTFPEVGIASRLPLLPICSQFKGNNAKARYRWFR